MKPWKTRLQEALATLVTDESTAPRPDEPSAKVLGMLGELGPALLAGSQPTNEVAATLSALAKAYDRTELRVATLPTLVLIDDPAADPPRTSVFSADLPALRLEQVDAIERLITRAAKNQIDPDEVVDRAAKIVEDPPRFGFWLSLVGHVLLTVGFGLVLNPTAAALPIYAILGVIIGVLLLAGSRVRTLALVLPVIAAFVATLFVGLAAPELAKVSILSLVTPALASLLPGLTLTMAAVELTSGQIISGASRTVYGFATLALLAFGVYVGITVTGMPHAQTSSDPRLGVWAPWLGILLVAFGYYLYSVAPKHSFIWILFALTVAYSGQLLGNVLLGSTLSGLIGALIVVPTIYLVAHVPMAPSPAVMLTCAYWMMVPGSMGFIGLSKAASGTAGGGSELLQTVGAVIAIAIGMVIGTGISRDTSAVSQALRRQSARNRKNKGE